MKLHGILPAIVTPINDQGVFQTAPFERLVERIYKSGAHGLYVCGQTGEGLQQPAAQRKLVAEAALRNSPSSATVMVHIGAATTAEAIDLARHASRAGAHAVSSLPPAGSYSFAEVREYYRAVAAASSVPLLVYYFPAVSQAIATLDHILELCQIPGVVGLKFTDSDLYRVNAIKRRGHIVFNGSDEMLAAGLFMGADGGIGSTYNLIPHVYVELYDAAQRADWTRARELQNAVCEFIEVILRYPINAAVKSLLAATGIDCGPAILPRRALTAAEEADLHAKIAETAIGRTLLPAAARR